MGSCTLGDGRPKKRYPTRSAAKQAWRDVRARLGDAFDDRTRPYRCPVCGWFHLGHYPDAPAVRAHLRAKHRGDR